MDDAALLLPIEWSARVQINVADAVSTLQVDFSTEMEITSPTCPGCLPEISPPFSRRRTPDHGATLIRARVSGLLVPPSALSQPLTKPLDVTHYEIHGWTQCDPSDPRPSPGPGDPFAIRGLSILGDDLSLEVDPGAPKELRPTCGGQQGEYLPGYYEAWERLHADEGSLPFSISGFSYSDTLGGWEKHYERLIVCPRPTGQLYGECPDGTRVYGSFSQVTYREKTAIWVRPVDPEDPPLPFPQ